MYFFNIFANTPQLFIENMNMELSDWKDSYKLYHVVAGITYWHVHIIWSIV